MSRRVPLRSEEGRRLVERGPAWREDPAYYRDEPSDDEPFGCDRLHCGDPIGPCDDCPNRGASAVG